MFKLDPEVYKRHKDEVLRLSNSFQRIGSRGCSDREIAEQLGISPRTVGHFGRAGTFLWVDPDAEAACVVLTDRDFGPWAIEAWPPFTDRVLAAL